MTADNRPIRVTAGWSKGEAAAPPPLPDRPPQSGYQTPLIDIHDGPEGLILEADLPGVTEQGVTIQLEDNVLSLQAQAGCPVPDGARPLHQEYQPGVFHRSFILSDEVARGRIIAELNNGVLRLTLPRAERAQTRRIEIKSSK